MILLLLTALFVGAFGILLIIAPEVVIKIEQVTDRIIETDTRGFSRRFIWGTLFIIAGGHMIYVWISWIL